MPGHLIMSKTAVKRMRGNKTGTCLYVWYIVAQPEGYRWNFTLWWDKTSAVDILIQNSDLYCQNVSQVGIFQHCFLSFLGRCFLFYCTWTVCPKTPAGRMGEVGSKRRSGNSSLSLAVMKSPGTSSAAPFIMCDQLTHRNMTLLHSFPFDTLDSEGECSRFIFFCLWAVSSGLCIKNLHVRKKF